MDATFTVVANSLKAAFDLCKSLLDLRPSNNDIATTSLELLQKIGEAQASVNTGLVEQATMIQRIHDLEKEIARMKTWDTEKQRYKLVEPWRGCVAYAIKESMANGEPSHLICTNCYENSRKSILNPIEKTPKHIYGCPNCSCRLNTNIPGTPTIAYAT